MVQLSGTRCNCIAILWVSLVNLSAITRYVASQRVFIVVSVYFVADSVRKLLDTPSYITPSRHLLHARPVLSSGPLKAPITCETRPLIREDAPWQTKPQLSWLQPECGDDSQKGSTPRRTDWLTDQPSVAKATLTLTQGTVRSKNPNTSLLSLRYVIISLVRVLRQLIHTDSLRRTRQRVWLILRIYQRLSTEDIMRIFYFPIHDSYAFWMFQIHEMLLRQRNAGHLLGEHDFDQAE
jgi:hypothetical protein